MANNLSLEELNALLAELALKRERRPERLRVQRSLNNLVVTEEELDAKDLSTQARGE